MTGGKVGTYNSALEMIFACAARCIIIVFNIIFMSHNNVHLFGAWEREPFLLENKTCQVMPMVVGLFAELGSLVANVSSRYATHNYALMMSPRLAMKQMQPNYSDQRTSQRPSTLPELPTFSSIVTNMLTVRP
ncbi:hypothetical protein T265_10783 [Opisthorchis viverrini]|uniref:Uncharacterized protein n=1 Tax=Opisthorchis viverrini TaxID=6198 RepID=A0A075A005_OPIVI|nr:hypothetical protein T265_10783 [Opisthorchis viverrini]KER20729.1 hypothetical protein T265_10783 [Opisthorchis viverrini]